MISSMLFSSAILFSSFATSFGAVSATNSFLGSLLYLALMCSAFLSSFFISSTVSAWAVTSPTIKGSSEKMFISSPSMIVFFSSASSASSPELFSWVVRNLLTNYSKVNPANLLTSSSPIIIASLSESSLSSSLLKP